MNTERDSQEDLTLIYSGPGLRDGGIDAAVLGPALTSIGDLFAASNRTLNDDRAQVRVYVRTVRPGSVEINVSVQQLFDQTVTLFSGQKVTALANILALLGFAWSAKASLLRFCRWLGGKKPTSVQMNTDGTATVQQGKRKTVVKREVIELYQSEPVSRSLGNMLSPLREQGVHALEIRRKKKRVEKITYDELPLFVPVPIEEPHIETNVVETYLRIDEVRMRVGHKWKFHQNNIWFFARITDPSFNRKFENDEIQIGYSDKLRVKLRITTTAMNGDGTTEYEVIQVLDHIKAPHQEKLVLPGADRREKLAHKVQAGEPATSLRIELTRN